MAEALTLARPYARAAFAAARDGGALDAWSQALAVAAAVATDERVHGFLSDPRVTREQLIGLHLPPAAAADGEFAAFLRELAHFRRLGLLPEIHSLFEALRRDAEAVRMVKVKSARELDAEQTDKLHATLRKRFGQEVALEVSVDPELLGGVVIDSGGEVIDESIRGRLERLAGVLTH